MLRLAKSIRRINKVKAKKKWMDELKEHRLFYECSEAKPTGQHREGLANVLNTSPSPSKNSGTH